MKHKAPHSQYRTSLRWEGEKARNEAPTSPLIFIAIGSFLSSPNLGHAHPKSPPYPPNIQAIPELRRRREERVLR